jgi:hypothetical protein
MAETADNNFDEEREPSRADQTTPRTPWLLWVIVFLIVTLLVIWSIRTYGPRSPGPEVQPTTSSPAGSIAPEAR